MNEYPNAGELCAALEEELRQISALAPTEIRMRLLVAAHCAGLIKREEGTKALASGEETERAKQTALVNQILSGECDGDLSKVRTDMRDEVCRKLEVASPRYAQS